MAKCSSERKKKKDKLKEKKKNPYKRGGKFRASGVSETGKKKSKKKK
jgi:hypothetical protein